MRSVKTLCSRLHDTFDHGKLLRIIATLVEIGNPAAIPDLALLLDTAGDVGRAAVDALIGFGPASEPAMRRCLESLDEDMIRNAHRVLAALGDRHSAAAQYASCWVELEEGDLAAAAE